jgi:threonylcarbamoyladenosine tRNA methylthiotransferase MtaB
MAARHPDSAVVVTGCHADSDPGDYEDAGIALVAGNAAKGDLLARLGLGPAHGDGPFHEATVRAAGHRTRAFVKVQDGCHLRCAYCIIPSVRPDLLSKAPDTVVDEVADLVRSGFREVVLTGIHLGAYGRDLDGTDALADLVSRLLDETALPRLRLSSIEVGEVSDRLLDLWATRHDRLVPHLHVPLQSGSDRVLRAMRRRYRVAAYRELIRRVGDAVPEPALATDVIVGFPGESPADFEETLDLCASVGFLKIHVFPFSVRRGTPAAALPGRVPGPEIRERAARLEAVGRATGDAFRARFVGRSVPVLVENRRRSDGRLTGLSDRYVRVDLEGDDRLMNTIVPVQIRSLDADRARGLPA